MNELVKLLPELAFALRESTPHMEARRRTAGEPLTARQMEAVVFLAHRREATMGELAAGLEIGRAAASELVTRLCEKGVVQRRPDAHDARVVRVVLAGSAERNVHELLAHWAEHLDVAFAAFPTIDPDTLVAFLRALIASLKGRPPQ